MLTVSFRNTTMFGDPLQVTLCGYNDYLANINKQLIMFILYAHQLKYNKLIMFILYVHQLKYNKLKIITLQNISADVNMP